MGCDIHMYVEYRQRMAEHHGSEKWYTWGDRFNPGRNYLLFGALAGVRDDTITPIAADRGIPEDASWGVDYANKIYIRQNDDDTDGVDLATAQQWAAHGSRITEQDGKPAWVTNPDWHSHSWCTADELSQVLEVVRQHYPNDLEVEYVALIAAMRALEHNGCEVRCVFWFDN